MAFGWRYNGAAHDAGHFAMVKEGMDEPRIGLTVNGGVAGVSTAGVAGE